MSDPAARGFAPRRSPAQRSAYRSVPGRSFSTTAPLPVTARGPWPPLTSTVASPVQSWSNVEAQRERARGDVDRPAVAGFQRRVRAGRRRLRVAVVVTRTFRRGRRGLFRRGAASGVGAGSGAGGAAGGGDASAIGAPTTTW